MPRVIIHIEGGRASCVYADVPVSFIVEDHDNAETHGPILTENTEADLFEAMWNDDTDEED